MPTLPYRETLRRRPNDDPNDDPNDEAVDWIEPTLGERVWLAPSAWVTGDVVLGDDVSFWFHTVARGDVNIIRVGARTNVQDGAVLHVTHDTHPLHIGEGVVIGHGAIVHGCTLEDGCLIGIGATVLDGAVVERGAQVAAGALVPPNARVPAGQLVMGVPARPVRALRDDESRAIDEIVDRYARLKETYRLAWADARRAGLDADGHVAPIWR